VDNGTILIIVGIVIIVLVARKWDSFKWIFGLGLVILMLYTAYTMGMLDTWIPSVPDVKIEP
jgi:uncharacterized membrane protein